MDHIGVCKYCGQTQLVKGGAEMTEEQINKAAALQCNCEGAQTFQNAENKITQAESNVKAVFAEEGPQLIKALTALLPDLAWKRITKVSLVTGEGIRATLTAKDSTIKVERTETIKTTAED